MQPDVTKHSYFSRKTLIILYSLIFLAWLKVVVELFFSVLFDRDTNRAELVWDTFFSTLLTIVLVYTFNKFTVHVHNRLKEQVRLFRKNPHPMWIYDLKTLQFLTVNEAATRLYGYSEEEFLRMSIKDIRPQEDVPALIEITDQIRLHFNHQYHWNGTWRHSHKNGQLLYVEVSSHEIIFEGRKAELVLAYDVTEKILQDQKLQALNQELERKVMSRTNDLLLTNKRLVDQNKVIKAANLELFTISNELQEASQKIQEHADLKNRFTAMASHELRTPLANILFSAGFIRRYFFKLDPRNIFSKVQAIETQVNHMTELLDDLLIIGKTNGEKLEINASCVNVRQFIDKIIDEVQTANRHSHVIHLSVCGEIPEVINTDMKFLRNIFINLLSNAIKYSPEAKDVYLRIGCADNRISFDITDQGLGINSHEIERIFEPFYRMSATQNIQGTGLGLSIVKRAAELLNGDIRVKSEVGKGSTFSVLLPAA
jgi:PAS domain S-box-containing protein